MAIGSRQAVCRHTGMLGMGLVGCVDAGLCHATGMKMLLAVGSIVAGLVMMGTELNFA